MVFLHNANTINKMFYSSKCVLFPTDIPNHSESVSYFLGKKKIYPESPKVSQWYPLYIGWLTINWDSLLSLFIEWQSEWLPCFTKRETHKERERREEFTEADGCFYPLILSRPKVQREKQSVLMKTTLQNVPRIYWSVEWTKRDKMPGNRGCNAKFHFYQMVALDLGQTDLNR